MTEEGKKHIIIHTDHLDNTLEETCSPEKALKILQGLQECYRIKLKWTTERLKVRWQILGAGIDITVSISTKGNVDPGKALVTVVVEMCNQIEAHEEAINIKEDCSDSS